MKKASEAGPKRSHASRKRLSQSLLYVIVEASRRQQFSFCIASESSTCTCAISTNLAFQSRLRPAISYSPDRLFTEAVDTSSDQGPPSAGGLLRHP